MRSSKGRSIERRLRPPRSRARNLFVELISVMRARSGALQGLVSVSRDPSDFLCATTRRKSATRERKTRRGSGGERWRRRRRRVGDRNALFLSLSLEESHRVPVGLRAHPRAERAPILGPQLRIGPSPAREKQKKARGERARRERAEADEAERSKAAGGGGLSPSTRASRVCSAAALASRSLLRSPPSLPFRATQEHRAFVHGRERKHKSPYLACAFSFGFSAKEKSKSEKEKKKSETQ